MRIGIGYDIHRFQEGRPLVLGGVTLPGETGLGGHSDADVVLHAVIDALLGAGGQGDIGQRYPPDDPAYAGIKKEMQDAIRMNLYRLPWRHPLPEPGALI